jgi:hypothetical protein
MKNIFTLTALCFSLVQNSFAQCPVQFSQNGPIDVCQYGNLQLSVTPGADNYEWVVNGTPVLNGTADNLMVPTSVPNTFTYQVNATFGTCTSTTNALIVTVLPQPVPPVVTSSTYCQYDIPGGLQVTGTALLWYTTQVGGVGVPTNPVPITNNPGIITYWVSQTVGGCESEREPLTITVVPIPNIANISYIDPAYPALGSITVNGLAPITTYVLHYTFNNIPVTVVITSSGSGDIILTNLSEGTYDNIYVTLNNCNSNSMGPYVLVEQNTFPGDVWPGDVNNDHYANNNDVLDLALAYGQTGTVRTGASNIWINQPSTDWGIAQTNGEDMKHADCNGDGTVDNNDQDAITLNYGMYHPKGAHVPQAKSTSLPDLYFDLTGILFTAGTTASVPIKLGTNALPMNNILGLAAKIKVENVTLDNPPTIINTTSWIGNSSNTMNFYKGVNNNQTDWALARTDHNNVSGDGTIATLVMDIPTGATGDAILYFDDVKIINSLGQEVTDYNVVDDTATIIPVTITNSNKADNKITIVPNPSANNAELQLSLSNATDLQINITDMMGKLVWSNTVHASNGSSYIVLPAHLTAGIYSIQVKGITVSALKWIKQ